MESRLSSPLAIVQAYTWVVASILGDDPHLLKVAVASEHGTGQSILCICNLYNIKLVRDLGL